MAIFLNPYEHLNNQLIDVKAGLSSLSVKMEHYFAESAAPIDLIDGDELRKRLQISEVTLRKYREQGRIPYLLVGGQYRYNFREVVAALTVKTSRARGRG